MNEIFNAPEWCLESEIQAAKHRLGIGIWTAHKILKNYEPVNINNTITPDSSSVGNSNEPSVVSKPTRSRKTKSQTAELPAVPIVLAESNPLDLVPDMLRHKFTNGLSDTVSDGDSK